MNPLLTKVVGLFTGGEGKLVNAIGKVADDLITSKEEKALLSIEVQKVVNSHIEEISKQAIQETESYLKDVQSAREANVQIQNSDKASWLAKNIVPLLTVIVTVGFFGLLGYMLKWEVPKSNERIMDILLGSLGTAWITIIAFWFGSTQSSKERTKQLTSLMGGK